MEEIDQTKRRLRVAVYHCLHSGGAKRTLFEQVKRMACYHHVDLYAPSSVDHSFCDVTPYVSESHFYHFEQVPLFDSPFGRLNQLMRMIDLIKLRRVERRIAADIDRGGYDVVLVHPSRYTQSPMVLRFLNTPCVYYCHEPLRRFYQVPIARPYDERSEVRKMLDHVDVFNWAYRVALLKADHVSLGSASQVVVNSRFTQESVREIYGVEAKVSYHGVDVEAFRPLGLPKEDVVISVGALTPIKGFDFVIESLGRVPTEQRPKLFIVSNYEEARERSYLSQLAEAKGVGLCFHTLVDDKTLVEMYNRAIMTVYASVREPFGLVPLESMACGTPVVAVGEGGVRESVVHEYTGLLTDRDPGQFSAAIQILLDNGELTKRYGEQARKYVLEEWSWGEAVERLERHLVQVADHNIAEIGYE